VRLDGRVVADESEEVRSGQVLEYHRSHTPSIHALMMAMAMVVMARMTSCSHVHVHVQAAVDGAPGAAVGARGRAPR
jgi:hypothetical protein